MDSRGIGYLLLSIGLVLIVVSIFSVYQVFTGVAKPIKLFNQSAISLNLGSLVAGQLPPGAPIPSSEVELLSAASLNNMFNLTFHLILMTFVSGAGAKIANIGTMLVRPIEVKLRASEPQSK